MSNKTHDHSRFNLHADSMPLCCERVYTGLPMILDANNARTGKAPGEVKAPPCTPHLVSTTNTLADRV